VAAAWCDGLQCDESQARIHCGYVVRIAGEHYMTPLSSTQRNGDIDEVVVTATCDEHPYRPRGKIIKDYNLDVRIGQQSRDPGLPRTTAPRLPNDPGRNCEGETVCCGALQLGCGLVRHLARVRSGHRCPASDHQPVGSRDEAGIQAQRRADGGGTTGPQSPSGASSRSTITGAWSLGAVPLRA
jgi:hypothetical protein